jgi:hypothetical protein
MEAQPEGGINDAWGCNGGDWHTWRELKTMRAPVVPETPCSCPYFILYFRVLYSRVYIRAPFKHPITVQAQNAPHLLLRNGI